ncbi:ABC transporter substrate-binding protein [Paenibacillus sp. NPDC058071]|uniref:ABC transporter substrate-binding protein n=1 Tax=Paenibacillus sp. NPDC058071 TaxID=3346326 RepID=UPI0036DAA34A
MRKPSISFDSLLFQLEGACVIRGTEREMFEEGIAESHLLFLFLDGEGALHVRERFYSLEGEQIFWLPPGTEYSIDRGANRPVNYYRIAHHAVKLEAGHAECFTEAIWPYPGPLQAYPFARAAQIAERLAEMDVSMGDLGVFKRNLLFQELLGLLLESNKETNHLAFPLRAVQDSIQYVKEHYDGALSVRQLAAQAEVPYWQYAKVFRELTGKKPNDYITELRVERAKELLLYTEDPLREIARQSGFLDEYYLSRKFRQATGLAPRQFAETMNRRVPVLDWRGHEVFVPANPGRIVCFGETIGDLLALGMKPVGSDLGESRAAWYEEELADVADIGRPFDLEAVAELKPDLIIFSSADEQQYGSLAKIAPTAAFDSYGSMQERMEKLGSLLGMREEAEMWLRRYHLRADEMWKSLRTEVREGETATVFIYHRGERLFVMGTIGLTETLYHGLGFQPAERVRTLLEQQRAYKEISEKALADYAGDRIFLILPDNPKSRESTETLMESERWQGLKAVREGRAYLVEEAKWNFGDAFTQEKLLDHLPALLRSGGCSAASQNR